MKTLKIFLRLKWEERYIILSSIAGLVIGYFISKLLDNPIYAFMDSLPKVFEITIAVCLIVILLVILKLWLYNFISDNWKEAKRLNDEKEETMKVAFRTYVGLARYFHALLIGETETGARVSRLYNRTFFGLFNLRRAKKKLMKEIKILTGRKPIEA